jgi:hypothetical protein
MSAPVALLLIQFLHSVSSRRRTYAEAMDAWRSSCPRLTVWQDALLDGLIEVETGGPLRQAEVALTPRGRAILDSNQTPEAGSTGPVATPEPGAAAARPPD